MDVYVFKKGQLRLKRRWVNKFNGRIANLGDYQFLILVLGDASDIWCYANALQAFVGPNVVIIPGEPRADDNGDMHCILRAYAINSETSEYCMMMLNGRVMKDNVIKTCLFPPTWAEQTWPANPCLDVIMDFIAGEATRTHHPSLSESGMVRTNTQQCQQLYITTLVDKFHTPHFTESGTEIPCPPLMFSTASDGMTEVPRQLKYHEPTPAPLGHVVFDSTPDESIYPVGGETQMETETRE
eukprot:GDKI01035418.1.p1 GENE.GDKI01035418.1~~GDKI01035418.1.p1  ORF type:complete len:241 (-),score=61.53 GDKI01035418.1:144-866(-)